MTSITEYGWKIVKGKLECDWDSVENMAAVKERVGLLFKGCSSASACSTRRCGCVKKGAKCCPGCNCKNCNNDNVTVRASDPGTQQTPFAELDELEQEELTAARGSIEVGTGGGVCE